MAARKNSQTSMNGNAGGAKHRSPTPPTPGDTTDSDDDGFAAGSDGVVDAASVMFSREKKRKKHRKHKRNQVGASPPEVEVFIRQDWMGCESGSDGELLTYFDQTDRARVFVDRPAFSQKHMHERFQYEDAVLSTPNRRKAVASLRKVWNELTVVDILYCIFPILDWLPKYRWKEDLPSDLSAGFTVAVMHIPQGMAYALLANTAPIAGLYTAFFPVIIYIFLGTSAHISLGTFAIVSIMVAKAIDEHATISSTNDMTNKSESSALASQRGSAVEYDRDEVVSAVALVTGIWLLIFFMLQVSSFCSLLSHSLIRGFTTGASMHVFSSQVKHMLGIHISRFSDPFSLFKMYHRLFGLLGETNLITLAMGLLVIVVLELYHRFLEERLSRLLKGITFPVHLLVVLVGILISWSFSLNGKHGVNIVGYVKGGMPTPTLPRMSLLPKVAVNALTVAVVSYVITYSLASLMAIKHKYKISPNQELLAGGCCNVIGSFFSCLPVATSLSRTLVQDHAGCKSLMTSATSVFILLWVLLFAGPFFEPLPNAILSGIIIHALKGMFKQFSDLPSLWRHSPLDLCVWLSTFTATVLFGADLGLVVGVAVNLVSLVYWCINPRLKRMSETDFQDVNLESKYYRDTRESGRIVMAQLSGCFNFSNAVYVEDMVYEMVKEAERESEDEKQKPAYFLLDIGGISSVDYTACVALSSMGKNLKEEHNVKMGLVAVSGSAWHKMESIGVFASIHRHRCFPTFQDAISVLESKSKKAQ